LKLFSSLKYIVVLLAKSVTNKLPSCPRARCYGLKSRTDKSLNEKVTSRSRK
jgi:hypothetical protein